MTPGMIGYRSLTDKRDEESSGGGLLIAAEWFMAKCHKSKYREFRWLFSQAAFLLLSISCTGGFTGSSEP